MVKMNTTGGMTLQKERDLNETVSINNRPAKNRMVKIP